MSFSFQLIRIFLIIIFSGFLAAYGNAQKAPMNQDAAVMPDAGSEMDSDHFEYLADRFSDKQILRYKIPGWMDLTLQQKTLLYYLSQAGMSGRDILWDQNYKHNLRIRKTIEQIVQHYPGERKSNEFEAFITWAKQVWFSNGIHHHYSNDKFTPPFTAEYFAELVNESSPEAQWPLATLQGVDELLTLLTPVIFDPDLDAKKVNTAVGVDPIAESAVNFYVGLTEAEVTAYYENKIDKNNPRPVSWGLNSQLVKNDDGVIQERVWKKDGMYGEAIAQVVYWLEQAITVAENPEQRRALELLVAYYESGDLADFDAYNIAWVEDTESAVDVINGFIEVYNDPLGYRGSFESVVSFRNEAATQRIGTLSQYAQRFEDQSPIMAAHKKSDVVGITGRAITVVSETGDASPSTPIGINLPNSPWIRADYGSKSVVLANITDAGSAVETGVLEEFAWSEENKQRERKYGVLADHLRTDMHEVIGHASGKLNPRVGTPRQTLKQYASAMEEGRADLVGLYFLMDPFLVEIGVMPSLDVGRAGYDSYIRRGLITQLQRIERGKTLEEAHMRNRQEISAWVYEKGREDNVIERLEHNGKTYFHINDYERLRELFGQLLREHQRIKSEGDFEAARDLIENYGTQVDTLLHAEVQARYAVLDVAAYTGFINPRLVPVIAKNEIVDVRVEYPEDFVTQMLAYGEQYAFLPVVN